MDEDALIAAVSLPFWFPPVRRAGAAWMDAVFATDANIGAAIDRGADEVWVVWTVSRRGRWRPGPIAQYFSAVEAAANSRVDDWRARIERNNRSVAAGGAGEFGRHVALRWLAAEVPLHYLFAWTGAGVEEAVERGVHAARDWCDAQGIDRIRDDEPDGSGSGRLRFRERMAGTMGFGATQPEVGRDVGAALGTRLALELALDIPDLRRFRRDPQHEVLVSGVVDCDALGGRLPVTSGRARLLVDAGDPARKELRYRLHFLDGRGTPLVLTGVKQVVDDPGLDLWADTTTLATWIRREDLEDGHPDRDVGAGVLRLGVGSFVRQLFTFRTERPAAATLMAFASFFIRHLWQVYGAGSGRREGAGSVGR
jgi:hypothetical protein